VTTWGKARAVIGVRKKVREGGNPYQQVNFLLEKPSLKLVRETRNPENSEKLGHSKLSRGELRARTGGKKDFRSLIDGLSKVRCECCQKI